MQACSLWRLGAMECKFDMDLNVNLNVELNLKPNLNLKKFKLKYFWMQRNFGNTNCWQKKIGSKNFWGHINCWVKKF